MMERKKISKTLAYLLRHHPEGLDVDQEGWVSVNQLMKTLRSRGLKIGQNRLVEVVENDPKGRYELVDGQIRARYGHSLEHVDPTLTPADEDELFHGTTPNAVDNIMEEGLQSQGRQKVHLSATKDGAREVGQRHTSDPVLLAVEADEAMKQGINIERASRRVYVADEIPPGFLSVIS